ncbi:MAG: c-type cytochrome, partial [Verrucomicrobia bacterium]|nr:c-type cytochrome [Verrucomicrobiota bacterium]
MNLPFRHGESLHIAGAILAFAWLVAASCAFAQPEPSVPGVVATADDGARKIVFVTPTPDFTLAPNESIHPQLKPEFKAEWRGLLKIIRAGNYTLFADARVFVGEREIHAEPVPLAAGEHPLRIVFERKAGAPARLQLQWQSEHFAHEPVPADALAHRGEPREAAQGAKLARGRELFESLGCVACHRAELSAINRRTGPDLSEAGARLSPQWISKWLEDPQHFRTNTAMPAMSLMAPDRADITAFLATLKGTNAAPSEQVVAPERAAQGRELFISLAALRVTAQTACRLPDSDRSGQVPGVSR